MIAEGVAGTMEGMSLSFPHHFDTTDFAKLAFKTAQGLMALVLASGVISLALKLLAGAGAPEIAVTLAAMAVLSAIISALGVLMFRKLGGVTGTITEREVTATPAAIGGYVTEAPEGVFPLSSFDAVRVEKMRGKKGGRHERVYLQGRAGMAPDIFVSTGRRGSGDVYAKQLAELVRLPVVEKKMPY